MQPSPTVRPRVVQTRRLALDYGDREALPRHFVLGDIAMSHVVAMLSAVFPEGEDFFVRTVRNYRSDVADPELKSQVAGFIGQEAMHGREHRSFNERLGALGYPTRLLDRITHYGLGFGERVLPKSYQLAITAALEHYTATLAEVLLTDADARDLLDLESVRSLFLWHALEESEHKSVAFDVYRTTSGNHWVRVGVMNATTLGFLGGIGLAVLLSMLTDPTTYRHPARAVRSFLALRRSPWLKTEILRRLRDYNRRDFHPDDHDNAALTAEWRERLFGAEGSMKELVRSGADSAA